jgi:ferredoxin-NADP reductase
VPHNIKILKAEKLTHNVRRYALEKPDGYVFEPGQATDASIDRDGFRDRKNPFTFTALNDWDYLEFTIKSYFDRDGVTKALWELDGGDRLIIREPWGTITYSGPGTFIAGGAGVTPFIAILRQLRKDKKLSGHRLIVSNKRADDIILRDEFEAMAGEGLELTWTLTDDPNAEGEGVLHERVDEKFLKRHIHDVSQAFYLCGPDAMVKDLRGTLEGLGAKTDAVRWEK